MDKGFTIREATESDAARLVEIYSYYITDYYHKKVLLFLQLERSA